LPWFIRANPSLLSWAPRAGSSPPDDGAGASFWFAFGCCFVWSFFLAGVLPVAGEEPLSSPPEKTAPAIAASARPTPLRGPSRGRRGGRGRSGRGSLGAEGRRRSRAARRRGGPLIQGLGQLAGELA